jgi:VanZ family protein
VTHGPSLFARVVAWSLAAAIVMLSIVPPSLRPETVLPHGVEHFGVFYATGTAFGLAYYRRHLLLLPLLIMFTGGVEVLQLTVPGRHARFSDWVVDALAICVGALTPLLVRRMSSKIE